MNRLILKFATLMLLSLLFACSSAKEESAKKEINSQKTESKDYSQYEYKKEKMKKDEPGFDDFIMVDTEPQFDVEELSKLINYYLQL